MLFPFNYLFGGTTTPKAITVVSQIETPETIKEPIPVKMVSEPKVIPKLLAKLKNSGHTSSKAVYIVQNKTSDAILAIYNDIELAKKDGIASTYHNCRILEFKINGKCNYLNKVVYED